MLTILFYLCAFLNTYCFAQYTKYQLLDERGVSKTRGKWHRWGAAMRYLFFVMVAIPFFPGNEIVWADIILSAAICLPLFDILINVIALNVKWNYVGSTVGYDTKLGMKKWYGYAVILIVCILIRIFHLQIENLFN